MKFSNYEFVTVALFTSCWIWFMDGLYLNLQIWVLLWPSSWLSRFTIHHKWGDNLHWWGEPWVTNIAYLVFHAYNTKWNALDIGFNIFDHVNVHVFDLLMYPICLGEAHVSVSRVKDWVYGSPLCKVTQTLVEWWVMDQKRT